MHVCSGKKLQSVACRRSTLPAPAVSTSIFLRRQACETHSETRNAVICDVSHLREEKMNFFDVCFTVRFTALHSAMRVLCVSLCFTARRAFHCGPKSSKMIITSNSDSVFGSCKSPKPGPSVIVSCGGLKKGPSDSSKHGAVLLVPDQHLFSVETAALANCACLFNGSD